MRIETGPDKMLNLVKAKKRITFEECSKKLKKPKPLIEKWAQILAEEGLANIEYQWTTPCIVEKQMSKEEEEDKLKNMFEQRDFFMSEEDSIEVENVSRKIRKAEKEVEEDVKGELSNDKKEFAAEMEEARKIMEATEIIEKKKPTIDVEYRLETSRLRKITEMTSLIKSMFKRGKK